MENGKKGSGFGWGREREMFKESCMKEVQRIIRLETKVVL